MSHTQDNKGWLVYQIRVAQLQRHELEIQLHLQGNFANGLHLRLPRWIPGSYLIRDFAKNLVQMEAQDAKGKVEMQLTSTHSWKTSPINNHLQLQYTIYARDFSVRSAYADDDLVFINGTSVLLEIEECAQDAIIVQIDKEDFPQAWQVATALPALMVDDKGFGQYQAQNYAQAVDCPLLISPSQIFSLRENGIIHHLVLPAKVEGDLQHLANITDKIIQAQAGFWGHWPADLQQYWFLFLLAPKAYGGLEHKSSTVLMASTTDIPQSPTDNRAEVMQLYSLICHEYFHTWWVKRLAPKVLLKANLSEQVITKQLWYFEGITSYYDELLLVDAKVMDEQTYLERLGQEISRVFSQPGRQRQTLIESSQLAWIKFYQQDENAVNTQVSYYAKGALVALAIDLTLRLHGKTLGNFLRTLWQNFDQYAEGFDEDQLDDLLLEYSQGSVQDILHHCVAGYEDPPLEALLALHGFALKRRSRSSFSDMGGKDCQTPWQVSLQIQLQETNEGPKVSQVLHQGDGEKLGLQPGDLLLAADDIALRNIPDLEKILGRKKPKDTLRLIINRQGRIRDSQLQLSPAPQDRYWIEPLEHFSASQQILIWPNLHW